MGEDATRLSHVDDQGRARMVDVGAKDDTVRKAVAGCTVRLSAETFAMLQEKALPKGDVLNTAKVAGVMAAKKTSELIPMCHPLFLNYVDVSFAPDPVKHEVRITAETRTTGKTGVEMEALTACQVAALTIYDMCKAVQKDIVIGNCRLLHKSGGRSGVYDAD